MESTSAITIVITCLYGLFCTLLFHTDLANLSYFVPLTEVPRNGGDDKNKNVERNTANILPGNGATLFPTGS